MHYIRRSKINESHLNYSECLSDATQPTWTTMANMNKMKEKRTRGTRSRKQRYAFILFISFFFLLYSNVVDQSELCHIEKEKDTRSILGPILHPMSLGERNSMHMLSTGGIFLNLCTNEELQLPMSCSNPDHRKHNQSSINIRTVYGICHVLFLNSLETMWNQQLVKMLLCFIFF